jgi:hypothetical protein
VQEFDNIYNEMAKEYEKHDIKRSSCKQKENIKWERDFGAGRHFKLDVKNRFLMLLLYYHLYITFTLAGFLFDLDEYNLQGYTIDWKSYKVMCINSTENVPNNKEAKNSSRGSR